MSTVFLDTTVKLDLLSDNNNKAQQTHQKLDQYKFKVTSSYVKMEFKRAYIQMLVYLLNCFNEERDLGRVMSRITRLQGYQRQKYARCVEKLAFFFSMLSNKTTGEHTVSAYSNKIFTSYLRRMISLSYYNFNKGIDSITDNTECALARIAPVRTGPTFNASMKKCKSTDIKCKIVEFLRLNYSEFEKVKLMLESLPTKDQEQTNMLNSLNHVFQHHLHISDLRHCWHCSDAIIAIEAPTGATVLSSNARHFSPICNALGKPYIS